MYVACHYSWKCATFFRLSTYPYETCSSLGTYAYEVFLARHVVDGRDALHGCHARLLSKRETCWVQSAVQSADQAEEWELETEVLLRVHKRRVRTVS